MAKGIGAGDYDYAIAFQERMSIPDDKMEYYKDLAEMYVGGQHSAAQAREFAADVSDNTGIAGLAREAGFSLAAYPTAPKAAASLGVAMPE